MSLTTGLRAFSSDGSPLNFKIDGSNKVFYLNMPKTSIGLLECETIYLLEKNVSGDFLEPLFDDHVNISKDDDFFDMFSVNDGIIDIGIQNLSQYCGSPNYDQNGFRTDSGAANPIVIRLCFKPTESGFYDCRFLFETQSGSFTIVCYGEAEEQDDRMVALLERFGEELTHKEEIIFIEGDVNEDRPDEVLLNNKRKELLNIVGELQPKLSTVHGLERIISFFGYADILTVKEYYFNQTNNKICAFDLNSTDPSKLDMLKMNSFGLYYDIDKVVEGQFDQFGIPTVVDGLPLPYEEIAIKLFALKDYIEKRDIGGVSKILDIIGQKISFNRFKLRSWKNRNHVIEISKQKYPSATILYSSEYIYDIRVFENLVCPYLPDASIEQEQIFLLSNCYISHFAGLYNDSPTLYDSQFIDVGAKITLRNSSFDVPWNECDVPWLNQNEPQVTTWINIGGVTYYKYVLEVYNSRGFKFKKEVYDFSIDTFDVILPHTGYYDVRITLIGLNGIVSKKTFNNFVHIKSKSVETVSFYKIVEPDLQFFSTNTLNIEDILSSWDGIIYDGSQFTIEEGEVSFRTFEMVNYIPYNVFDGFLELNWKQYELYSWLELCNFSWENMEYSVPKLASAILSSFVAGGIFYLDDQQVIIPNTMNQNDYYGLANYLTANHGERFTYTVRIDNNSQQFIEILARELGSGFDFYICSNNPNISFEAEIGLNSWDSFASLQLQQASWLSLGFPWNASSTIYRSRSVDEEFNTNNLRTYENEFSVPVFTPVFMTLDKCKISGKKEASYKIYDSNGNLVVQMDTLNCCYRFREQGIYSLECLVKDVNENEYNIYKENIIKVVGHDTL